MQNKAPLHSAPSLANVCRDSLLGPKKASLLSLEDIQIAGMIFFGNAESVALYGMPPADYFERGIRIAGRTAIECVVDCAAVTIASALKDVLQQHFSAQVPSVVDLYGGSGNLLYQLSRAVSSPVAIGFENDPVVHRLTIANLQIIGFDATFAHGSCEALLDPAMIPRERPCVVLIAPPWGPAFDFNWGLDLSRTSPPVHEVMAFVRDRLPEHEVICVVQTHELLREDSVTALTAGRRVYARGIAGGLPRGRNVGFLMCSL